MKDPNQIAAEAAQQCANLIPASFGMRARDFESIIQSAIEKALKDYDSIDAYNFGYEQGLKAMENR